MQFFLDLSRAFDIVGSSILLGKLEFYGVRGSILLLISSYLDRRNCLLALEDMNQPVKKVKLGYYKAQY